MFDGAAASLPFSGSFPEDFIFGVKTATSSFFINPVNCQHITLGMPACNNTKKNQRRFLGYNEDPSLRESNIGIFQAVPKIHKVIKPKINANLFRTSSSVLKFGAHSILNGFVLNLTR
jgi:hypothetical protein